MSDDVTPSAIAAPGPHPLASELAARLRGGAAGTRVLLLGIGSGRNVPVLRDAGVAVDVVDDDTGRAKTAAERFAADAGVRVAAGSYARAVPFAGNFAAALSTHALLHGTTDDVRAAVAAIRAALRPGGLLFTTLGTKRDPRFGRGREVAPDTFAWDAGPEANVPHAYFDARGVRELLADFECVEPVARDASALVGAWAHTPAEAFGIAHWFVRARVPAGT